MKWKNVNRVNPEVSKVDAIQECIDLIVTTIPDDTSSDFLLSNEDKIKALRHELAIRDVLVALSTLKHEEALKS